MNQWGIARLCAIALVGMGRPAWAAKPISCGADVGLNVTVAGSTTSDQATPDAELGSTVDKFVSDGGVVYDPADPSKPLTDANGAHDNYGGCQTDANGNWFVLRTAGLSTNEGSNSSTTTHLNFNVSPLDHQGSLAGLCPGTDARCATSLVRVYHPTATSWTIVPNDIPMQQPSPAPDPPLWVDAHLTCGNACTVDAYTSTPFKITVVRQ